MPQLGHQVSKSSGEGDCELLITTKWGVDEELSNVLLLSFIRWQIHRSGGLAPQSCQMPIRVPEYLEVCDQGFPASAAAVEPPSPLPKVRVGRPLEVREVGNRPEPQILREDFDCHAGNSRVLGGDEPKQIRYVLARGLGHEQTQTHLLQGEFRAVYEV
ncbi:hypothetical protein [Actinopolymorpha sp. B9G3]|uniref:hypothetical protein n=1 Tax=Actinopolymorpha sp. B9G3 TaxID=3158970 RepID=UPI0032D8FE72